jgi:hypothetical protein
VTDCHEGEHLEVFDLQKGDLVVTDRANGLRKRSAFVLSKLADSIVRISPSKFPMQDEQGKAIALKDWLKGLQASAGQLCSRVVWITYAGEPIKLRLIAFRLSQEQQEKAERRSKRKASKNQRDGCSQTPCISRDGFWWSRPCHRSNGATNRSCACTKRVGILNCFSSA